MEDVLIAENKANKTIVTSYAISLNEFYDLLGLPPKKEYDELGWSISMMCEAYWQEWLEFDHEEAEMDDGTKYYILYMPLQPMPEYLEE